MEQKILNYFIKDLECSEEVASEMLEKLKLQEDIYREFLYWFQNKTFPNEPYVVIDGYTAQGLFEQFDLMEIGAFNLMVSLRTDHDETLECIKQGLPR